ncbi:MAG: hypothetical protein LBR37_01710 [Erysipelotrichaceae bacterium]|nr:hypothetical protein [Erysipelotrichaceae bacterium]
MFLTTMLLTSCRRAMTVYALEVAYNNGLLTKLELQSISYYYHDGNIEEDYRPIPKDPLSLDDQTIKDIKWTYAKGLKNIPGGYIGDYLERVTIMDYFGTYNDYIVVKMTNNYWVIDIMSEDYYIDGVLFKDYYYAILCFSFDE